MRNFLTLIAVIQITSSNAFAGQFHSRHGLLCDIVSTDIRSLNRDGVLNYQVTTHCDSGRANYHLFRSYSDAKLFAEDIVDPLKNIRTYDETESGLFKYYGVTRKN